MSPVTYFADEPFPEKGVRTPRLTLEDEEGIGRVPDTITYTLYNRPADPTEDPTVINSLEDVDASVGVEQASDGTVTCDIVLQGEDLSFLTDENGVHAERALVVKYQYDSDIGNNLNDKLQYLFTVERIYGV